ncbi:metal-independent phosphoserine phosphatase [Spinacia oleracea]|uniref:Metal-independent phosphoserine phosphatase n=1 Tax=Spinacia oleracea TaxID=3562 RepID=A0A9R0KD58_SPIOL|nr:metal-independent phosphoserine phosphatase [Spinacia oleracea]XP_056699038.1 metal-independent phosphoserine phosphatase [Spinacia oleracea]
MGTSSTLLKNNYWILRHGKSIPNQKGLIVSSLENGTLAEYQLADDGVAQAQLAGELLLKDLKDANIPLKNVRICYSPFARTAHTAKVVASVLNLPFEGSQCKVIEDLRERYFGPSYELSSHDKYPEIWELDEKDPFERPEGGESAADVVSRLVKAMEEMETMFEGCAILIVSHGDPLQMLQTIINAAKEKDVSSSINFLSSLEAVKVQSVISKHRKFALETGELRAVI